MTAVHTTVLDRNFFVKLARIQFFSFQPIKTIELYFLRTAIVLNIKILLQIIKHLVIIAHMLHMYSMYLNVDESGRFLFVRVMFTT